jgi:small subunit ribosomal protein S5
MRMPRAGRGDGPQAKELEERVVRINPVSKTHKGGRTRSFNALVVVGDGNGRVGAGIGKAKDVPEAIRKGVESAKRNMVQVKTVSGTITHEILASSGAATVLMRPASPGTGVVAGGSVRHILEAAGVKDVLSKSLGSSNPINNAWAALECLRQLRTAEEIGRLRGQNVDRLLPQGMMKDMGIAREGSRVEA